MEATLSSSLSAFLAPAITFSATPSSDPPPATVSMEDLHRSSSSTSIASSASSPSPCPSSSGGDNPKPFNPDGKPAKKRKSWGQELPEPKTNLPPRKRAKTDDEKEQRRIERVKRNRLAAHNSRERKRQEVELLQEEKNKLEVRLHGVQVEKAAMAEHMRRMAARLEAYRQFVPDNVRADEASDLPDLASIKIEIQSNFDMSESPFTSTIDPRQASFSSPEPMISIDSPLDTASQPQTPVEPTMAFAAPDETQHSAAMLWDLQCQSGATKPSSASTPTTPTASPQSSFRLALLSIMLLSLQASSMAATLASTVSSIWTWPIRPILSAFCTSNSPFSFTSTATTSTSNISSRRQRRTLTSPPRSARPCRSRSASSPPFPPTSLVRDSLTCSPTCAQLLQLATSLAQQRGASNTEPVARTVPKTADFGSGKYVDDERWRRLLSPCDRYC